MEVVSGESTPKVIIEDVNFPYLVNAHDSIYVSTCADVNGHIYVRLNLLVSKRSAGEGYENIVKRDVSLLLNFRMTWIFFTNVVFIGSAKIPNP